MKRATLRRALAVVVVTAPLFLGCASDRALREGEALISKGDLDAGLRYLLDQAQLHPNDVKLRTTAYRQLELRLTELFREGEAARTRGDYAGARKHYEAMLKWQPNHQRAEAGIAALEQAQRIDSMFEYANNNKINKPDDALAVVRQILVDNPRHSQALRLRDELENRKNRLTSLRPKLAEALKAPISLQLRDQPISNVFDLISRIAKVNFIFDRDVPNNLRTTIYAQDTAVEDVLNLILSTNQLGKKILSENSVLIYPKRPDKERDYRDLVMRTFYLNNADPKQVLAMLKQMVKTRDVYIDERLGLLVMRDTPEVIEIAERLIASQDLPQSEVVLDVEVLEVSSNDLLNLGVRYPDNIGLSVIGSNTGSPEGKGDGTLGVIKLGELRSLQASNVQVGLGSPTMLINMLHRKGNTNTLANPKIRVKNRDKASAVIGQRVPVVTTVNANGVVTESVTYLDVGLTLKVEPVVNLDDEVGVKLALEVSSLVDQVTTKSGLIAYTIGSRKIETNLTLKDGETQMLAGLINKAEQSSGNSVPGLGELPVLNRLFGSKQTTNDKSEIVLLITPRIVRNVPVPAPYITGFESGTEGEMSIEPLRMRTSPLFTLPPSNTPGSPPPPPVIPPPAPTPAANTEPTPSAEPPSANNFPSRGGIGRR